MFYQVVFWILVGVVIGFAVAVLVWQWFMNTAIKRGDFYMQIRRGKKCYEYGESMIDESQD